MTANAPELRPAPRSSSSTRRPVADREQGATLVQYALLLGLIAVAVIASLMVLGQRSNSTFEQADAGLQRTDSATPPASLPSTDGDGAGGGGGAGGGAGGGGGGAGVGTTTTLATPSSVTTAVPPAASSWTTSSATAQPPHHWASSASITIHGTDGKPLTGVNAGVLIEVIQEYRTWDGKSAERSWTTQANLSNGVATFANGSLNTGSNGAEAVVAMRYVVTGVAYYHPANPAIGWDGGRPSVRIAAP